MPYLKRKRVKKVLHIIFVIWSSDLKRPEWPFNRVVREGVGRFCKNCGSTMSRSGFLRLFGKRYCDNYKCKNSKQSNNYR